MAGNGEKLRRSSRLKLSAKHASTEEGTRQKERYESLNATSATLKTELEEELRNIEENIQKPIELFAEEEDVSGKRIYRFHTPSSKNAMVEKATLCRASITPQTSKQHSKLHVVETARTPCHVRNKIKRDLALINSRSHASGLTSSESESVSEGSEYKASESEEGSEDDEDEDSESEKSEQSSEDSEENKVKSVQKGRCWPLKETLSTSVASKIRTRSKANVAYSEYHLRTDEYFTSRSEKILTSDRTLKRLANPRLNEEKIQELLINENHISLEHKQGIQSLSESHRALFPMWYYIMEEGYSLLLHGLGSKRNLINNFYKEAVCNHPTLIVNGFFPSLTIKEILDGIIVDLLGVNSSTNLNDCFNLIDKTLRDNPEDRLYLLIHNIDGVMLRSNKVQDILSRLASIPNLCLMASVDHINAPLIWDNVKRSRYNFYWWDSTSLLPYAAETSYEGSLLVQNSGTLALSSLHNVFLSLTSNARAIYVLLVKYQLDNGTGNNYPGMAFKDLYQGAREAFLVSSDLALRAQLTEFLDHKLVRSKRNIDGIEYLVIPLDNALLKQFLEQHEDS